MDNSDFITITLISIIILIIILLLTLFRLHYVQSCRHEYGHVLKLKEMIYINIKKI
jgi:CHASE1-domain containing sensor protein